LGQAPVVVASVHRIEHSGRAMRARG